MVKMEKNVVYVGSKAPIIYAASAQQQASAGETEIHIRARGRATSRAIDVSQLAINRFLTDWEVADVKIGTEEREFERENRDTKKMEKVKVNVSTLDITLKKKPVEEKQ